MSSAASSKMEEAEVHPPQARCWREVRSDGEKPQPRSGAASVVVNNKMYVYGGYGGDSRLDDLHEFDFELNKWTRVVCKGPSPGARENNGVVVRDNKLILFGGYSGSSWLNDMYEFDLETREWKELSPAGTPPSPRFGYVSAVHNDRFVLFAGYDGSTWLQDLHEYNFTTNKWRQITPSGAVPSIRSCPSWAARNGCIYVFGGYDGIQRMNDFFEFDMTTYSWRELHPAGTPPAPRYFHACAMTDDSMVVFGGYDGTERLRDLHTYSFATNRWSRVDCTPGEEPPIGRSSLVAEVCNGSLYIFGGYNGSTVLNDFYQFRIVPIVVPPPRLVSDLKAMIDNEELSDVTFVVEEKEVHASRCLLAARSEHFRAMLFGGMREASGTEPIPIHDVSYVVFRKILEYLYTDRVEGVDAELAEQILVVSEQYLLERLKCLCEDVLRAQLHVGNAATMFMLAHRYRAHGLRSVCLDFILHNLERVKRSDGFHQLKHEPDLLMEIIMRQK